MRQALFALFSFTIAGIASAQSAVGSIGNLVPASPTAGRPVAAVPVVQKWQTFVDPNEGAFQVQMPVGWKDADGLKRYDALQYRAWATAVSPDGASILVIGDPDEPSYATPMMGFAPGSVYNATGTYYLVEPLQSAQQYAVTWGTRKLQSLCAAVKVTSSRARPDIAQQLGSVATTPGMSETYGDATFSCRRNGMQMSAYALLGVVVLRTSTATALWYANSMVSFIAPAPVAAAAANVLAQMVKSFTISPQWLARQSQTAMNVSQIATRTNNEISNIIMGGWAIRNGYVHTMVDPVTGTVYEIPNDVSYAYYWVDSSGSVVGTNTATSPGPSYKRLNNTR
jgi:hypothetical protein